MQGSRLLLPQMSTPVRLETLLLRIPKAIRRGLWSIKPWMILVFLVALYAMVSFVMSSLRWQELNASTFDLGLYQQSLWATSHGKPFYEAADFETSGFPTFLEVHTVFILYLLVPAYQVYPSPYLLFAVQSAAVASGAIPLYWMGRDCLQSGKGGLLVAGMYLLWAPLLAANLYDFHVEAFLPVELFSLFWLWGRSKYLPGALVAAASFVTLEVAPLMVAALAVYFLTLPVRLPHGFIRERGRKGLLGPPVRTGVPIRRRIATYLDSTAVVASWSLLAACIVAYFLLRVVQTYWIPVWFHLPLAPEQTTGTLFGTSLASLGLSWQSISTMFPQKIAYWILLYGLVGMIPFLAPRSFILAIPWFAYTLLAFDPAVVVVGYQFSFVAAIPVFIGFVLGLQELRRFAFGRRFPYPSLRGGQKPDSTPLRRVLTFALIVVILVNILVSPIDPLTQGSGAQGYAVSYTPASGFSDVETLAQMVPSNGVVLATPDLFPLVANDNHAFTLLPPGILLPSLPFNISHLPTWVFISQQDVGSLPSWLSGVLYNQTAFALRGVVWTSARGTVLLFEHYWKGPYLSLGQPPSGYQTFRGDSLSLGPAGYLATTPSGAHSQTIFSIAGETGNMWFGPYTSLDLGNYTIQVNLSVHAMNPSVMPQPNEPVFQIQSGAFAQPTWYSRSFLLSNFDSANFTRITFEIDVMEPSIDVQVAGYLLSPLVEAQLVAISVTPVTHLAPTSTEANGAGL